MNARQSRLLVLGWAVHQVELRRRFTYGLYDIVFPLFRRIAQQYCLLEEIIKYAFKLHISQNNYEKHGFTVGP